MALIPNFQTHAVEARRLHRVESFFETDAVEASPQAMIDTPQHRLTDWIKECGPKNPLGKLPDKNLHIGIIGGGAAGVVAAYEAVKAGATVTLIEARCEVGGRARSVKMDKKNKNVGEEGCMRFPPSEACLYLLADTFGYGFVDHFPDPGVVSTLVVYEGESQLWTDPDTPPTGFETVTAGWKALVKGGCEINGKKFASAVEMAGWLKSREKQVRMNAQKAWQDYIDEFKDDSFLHGLEKIFSHTNATPPAGKTWTDNDFRRFGKLGIGSGGFGAFFSHCFLTIWRFIPNQWESHQSTFAKKDVNKKLQPAGIQELWHSIWQAATDLGLKTLLETKATAVSKTVASDGGGTIYTVTVEEFDGWTFKLDFDELFINVTTKVADIDLKLSGTETGTGGIFCEATCEAMKKVHMARTTKLFITVPRKPFDDTSFPRVLLTDGDLPQLYCLDYGDENTVVVMVVYAWETYSERLEVEKDAESLFEHLKALVAESVANSEFPNWANCLDPVDGTIKLKHWQDDPTTRGAFTFPMPSQNRYCATLFYDYEKGEGPYLIGDSFSFGGGWIESALETAYTCFSAMLKRRGKLYNEDLAPVNCLSSSTYKY